MHLYTDPWPILITRWSLDTVVSSCGLFGYSLSRGSSFLRCVLETYKILCVNDNCSFLVDWELLLEWVTKWWERIAINRWPLDHWTSKEVLHSSHSPTPFDCWFWQAKNYSTPPTPPPQSIVGCGPCPRDKFSVGGIDRRCLRRIIAAPPNTPPPPSAGILEHRQVEAESEASAGRGHDGNKCSLLLRRSLRSEQQQTQTYLFLISFMIWRVWGPPGGFLASYWKQILKRLQNAIWLSLVLQPYLRQYWLRNWICVSYKIWSFLSSLLVSFRSGAGVGVGMLRCVGDSLTWNLELSFSIFSFGFQLIFHFSFSSSSVFCILWFYVFTFDICMFIFNFRKCRYTGFPPKNRCPCLQQ